MKEWTFVETHGRASFVRRWRQLNDDCWRFMLDNVVRFCWKRRTAVRLYRIKTI